MDWKTLRDKAVIVTAKTKVIATQALQSSKEYATLAGIKSYDALKISSFAIKNEGDFEKSLTKDKKVIILLLDSESAKKTDFILQYPLYLARCWIESVTLKICDREVAQTILHNFWACVTPSVHCFLEKKIIARYETSEAYADFVKKFVFPSNSSSNS